MKKKYGNIIIHALIFNILTGCGLAKIQYSASGASISPAVKTYSIEQFPNKALQVDPDLSNNFYHALNKYIRGNTGLNEMTNNNGDIRFEGEITGYSFRPVNIKSNEEANANRLTIEIRVKFTNTLDEKNNFDQKFSHYADYSIDEDFNAVKEAKTKEILDKIIEDIYNKAFVNW